jgi:hypothetical protein
MTETTNTTETPISDILCGALAVLFLRGHCLGRIYSVGRTYQATGEIRLAVLDLQGCPVREYADINNETVFEAAYLFATLEANLPIGVGESTVPQYSTDHPSFPARS